MSEIENTYEPHSIEFMRWLDRAYRDGTKGDTPKFTKWNMEVAYRAGQDSLPFRAKELAQALVLFRKSNNAHGYINVSILSEMVDSLPEIAKREMANIMVNIALGLDPENEIIAAKVKAGHTPIIEDAGSGA